MLERHVMIAASNLIETAQEMDYVASAGIMIDWLDLTVQ